MIRLTLGEIRKTFLIAKSYTVDFIADQAMFIVLFLFVTGVFEVSTDWRYSKAATLASMIGWIVWRAGAGCMDELNRTISDDAKWGTLEQVWLASRHKPGQVLAARSVALVIYYSLYAVIMAVVLMLVLGLQSQIRMGALLIYLLTLLGPIGLAFAIAGLNLVYKNVTSLSYIMGTIILFLSGAITPIERPIELFIISRILPFGIGIDLLRSMLVEGQSLLAVLTTTSFAGLIVQVVCYLGVGWLVLRWARAKAKTDALLAHY